MKEIKPKYDFKEVEEGKYDFWLNGGFFTAGDLTIIHDIYDECIRRGMKPVRNTGKYPHPTDVRKRIVNGMKTGYLFEYSWFPESILRKCSVFTLKQR